jgi:hypothetical protein
MKGLLIKDLQLVFSNKTIFPVFIVIAIMLLFTGSAETVPFVVAYFTMLCGMMAVSTVNYDELDHSTAFLMTMPITRKLYAKEKYIFTLLGVIAGWSASILIGLIFGAIKHYQLNITEVLIGSITAAFALYVLLNILLPVQLKYGNEKSRIVMIVIVAVVILGVALGNSLLDKLNINKAVLEQRLEQFFTNASIPLLLIIIAIVGVAVTFISLRISEEVMKKKQF